MKKALHSLLAGIVLCTPQMRARANDDVVLAFNCKIERRVSDAADDDPAWGRQFSATVPFGDGETLALLDPETSHPRAVVHPADVLAGRLRLPSEDVVLVWSRATSSRASMVGQSIRGNGHVVALILSRPIGPDRWRNIKLFDSESGSMWDGSCSERP